MDNGERLALEFMSKALELVMGTGKGVMQGVGTISTETFKAIYQYKKENRLYAGENDIEKLRNADATLAITQIASELDTEKFVENCKSVGIPCSVNQIGEKNIVTFLKSDEELIKMILEEMVKENIKKIEQDLKEVDTNKVNDVDVGTVDGYGTVSAETFKVMYELAKETDLQVGENIIEKLEEPDVVLGITQITNEIGTEDFLEGCKKTEIPCSLTQLGETNIVTYLKSDEELIKEILEEIVRENIKKIEPEIKADVEANTETELEAGVEAEIEPNIETEVETGVEAEIEASVETNIEAEVGVEPKKGAVVEPNIETDVESETEAGVKEGGKVNKEAPKTTTEWKPINPSEYKTENKNPKGNIKKLVSIAKERLKENAVPSIDKEKSLDNTVKSVEKER